MKLTHSGDDRLSRLLIGISLKGGIFFGKSCKGKTHLLLTCFCLGLDCDPYYRLGEFHGFKYNGMILVAERVTRCGVFKTNGSGDVACIYHIKVFSLIGVHTKDTSDSLLVVLRGVQYVASCRKRSGVNSEEAKLTNKGIGDDLECKSRERLGVARMPVFLLAVKVCTLDSGNVCRSGHIVNDSVKKGLNTLVSVRRSAEYRNNLVGDSSLSYNLLKVGNGNLFTVEVPFHKPVIISNNLFKSRFTILLSKLLHILGNVLFSYVGTVIVVINLCLHCEKVDNALKGIFLTDRQLKRDSLALKSVLHHLYNVVKVSAHDVHLVDERHSRNAVSVSLAPNGLRLGLNTALSAENRYASVKNS